VEVAAPRSRTTELVDGESDDGTVDGFAEHVAAVVEMAVSDVPHCRSTIAGGNAVRKGSPDFRAS